MVGGAPANARPYRLNKHRQAMNGKLSLEQRLFAVRQRIERAEAAAGRPPDSVRLLAVSKTFSAGCVRELAQAGQTAFGENYLQEALGKMIALGRSPQAGDLARTALAQAEGDLALPLEWHFIGPIQSNKTRKIAESFDWVQSVAQERIARRLSEQRPMHLGPLNLCLQVNVSGEESKSGCQPDEIVQMAGAVAALPGLALRGLMAIPEPTKDLALQARRFGQVRELFDAVRASLESGATGPTAAFDTLSMGMSADLETAIEHGATIVRVGSALFGERPVE